MRWKRVATTALAFFLVAAGPVPGVSAATRGDRETGPTPPRLSFTDGDVSFWRPGAEDWAPAKVNTPIAAGDSLYTGDGGNLELQVGPSAFVRAGGGTELGLESLENDLQQFKLTSGHAAVDARRLPKGQAIEVDTPNGALTIDRPGYYRIDVDENRTTYAARRGGVATLVPANGEATEIGADRQIVLEGSDNPELTQSAATDPDDWDRWNLDRGERASQPARSSRYAPDVAGAEDLDQYGEWRDEPRYGHVWVPHEVPSDWAPYSTGRWVWDPYYGWSWVDDAPWGWAPYHYGRWVYAGGYWGWAPGPVVVAPVYSPALVAFFGPSVGVSIGVPFPFVSWVALGWGEPIIPWWGGVGFVGTCWWGGWGGPRIVNNVVIQHNTFVNVRNVTVFQNQHVRNAMIGVYRDHFGRGGVDHVRLTANDAQRLHPIHGRLGVNPTPASLVAKEGHAIRPPQAVHARPVVATRPPQDLSHNLHAAGLNPGSSAAPPPRIVHGPQGRGGSRQASLPTRTSPPPPPGGERGHQGSTGTRPAPPQMRTERSRGGAAGERTMQDRPRGGRSTQSTSRAPEPTTPPSHHRAERGQPAQPAIPRGGQRPTYGGSPQRHGGPPVSGTHEQPRSAPHGQPHSVPQRGLAPGAAWRSPDASRAAAMRPRNAPPARWAAPAHVQHRAATRGRS